MNKNKLESQIADLTVIKDSLLFKVLVKLVAKQEEANQSGTDTFGYSLNEFRLDLQIGKATLVRKFEKLEQLGFLKVIKNITVPEGRKQSCYLKTDYRVNLSAVNDLIKELAPLSQMERVEHINNMLCVITPKSLYSIRESLRAKEEPVKQKKVKSAAKQKTVKLNPIEIKNPIYAEFIKEFPSGTFSKETDELLEVILNDSDSTKIAEYFDSEYGWNNLNKGIGDEDLYYAVKYFIDSNFLKLAA